MQVLADRMVAAVKSYVARTYDARLALADSRIALLEQQLDAQSEEIASLARLIGKTP